MLSESTPDGGTLRGYRCVGDVAIDLDGAVSTELGWVLFEVASRDPDTARGILGTFNHHATLQVLRHSRAKRPCRICGEFEDGVPEARPWVLDDVVFTAVDGDDVSGFVAFRAAAFNAA